MGEQQHGYDRYLWKEWKSKEDAGERERRKIEEAEFERRWIKHEYGEVCW